MLGIDIRAHEIRWVQLEKQKKEWRIQKFGTKSWQAPPLNSPNYWQDLRLILLGLAREYQFKGNAVALALTAKQVASKRIQLSASFTGEELSTKILQHLQLELQELGNVGFDYVKMNRSAEGSPEFMVVAAKQEQLNGYIHLFQEVNLKLKIIDVDYYALTRAILFVAQHSDEISNTMAIFDVNATSLQFIVLHQKKIIFTHQWDIAPQQDIARHLQQCIELYHSANPVARLEEIVLSGDSDCLNELRIFLNTSLSIPVGMCNPFSSMQLNPALDIYDIDKFSSRMLVCFGLAMRQAPLW